MQIIQKPLAQDTALACERPFFSFEDVRLFGFVEFAACGDVGEEQPFLFLLIYRRCRIVLILKRAAHSSSHKAEPDFSSSRLAISLTWNSSSSRSTRCASSAMLWLVDCNRCRASLIARSSALDSSDCRGTKA